MSRCYNFCAGPAALPEAVLEIAREDMLEWHGKGLSLMEMSHRSREMVGIADAINFAGAKLSQIHVLSVGTAGTPMARPPAASIS